MTSGPMPSPAMTAIRWLTALPVLFRQRSAVRQPGPYNDKAAHRSGRLMAHTRVGRALLDDDYGGCVRHHGRKCTAIPGLGLNPDRRFAKRAIRAQVCSGTAGGAGMEGARLGAA